MKHTDKEMLNLTQEVSNMWLLVISQLEKARTALLGGEIALATEVINREKRVDTYELQIDRACENYIALYSPVAVDLRQTLSLMAICRTLERIGDFAAGIAMHVLSGECQGLPQSLVEELKVERMLAVTERMLADSYTAFLNNSTYISGQILAQDAEANAIYHQAPVVLTRYLSQHPEHIYCGLKTMLLLRKVERIGDHCSNIVEELVFYIDAKVLKHGRASADKSTLAAD